MLALNPRSGKIVARIGVGVQPDAVAIGDDAVQPVVPAFNFNYVTLVSARVGNYQYNPQFGVVVSQLWVQ